MMFRLYLSTLVKQGNIYAVEYICQKKNIPREELIKGFRVGCYNNHLKVSTWLSNLFPDYTESEFTDSKNTYMNNEYLLRVTLLL